VVGAGNIERAYPDAITCFILPPSWAEVEARLRARGSETEASIARRLARGRDEMEAARQFQYLVENDDLQVAVDHLDAIYRAAGLRRSAGERRLDALLREAR
jgi:guanylate kinase